MFLGWGAVQRSNLLDFFLFIFKINIKIVFLSELLLYICVTIIQNGITITTKNHNIMTTQMTIREIRTILFETNKYTVIGSEEMTNKESRDFLYAKDKQDEKMNIIDNGSHLLIWEVKN